MQHLELGLINMAEPCAQSLLETHGVRTSPYYRVVDPLGHPMA